MPKKSKKTPKKKDPNFLAGLDKGAYHKQKGIPPDETIPMTVIMADLHSANPKTRKRANFAKVARTWKKRKGK